MSTDEAGDLRRQLQEQHRIVAGLQSAIYAQAVDPSANPALLEQLANALIELSRLERLAVEKARPVPSAAARPGGRLLGPETTGLRVETQLHMHPLPTGIYHLLDPSTDPLFTVMVGNESDETRRICVKAYIEGLSARAVSTVEIERGEQAAIPMLPTLLPGRARGLTEVQRATLHILVYDLDRRLESHNTFGLLCLARTSSFNSVRNPGTGLWTDLSHYYGAWVTPRVEAVQQRIRRAADLAPNRLICGYQGNPDAVGPQVAALYQSLREAEIVYVNSVIDWGARPEMATQRTRLPRESLRQKSANCIDGSVLLASLLEGATLNPALVFVPGHAFLGWETWDGSNEWRFLETTLIGSADFEAACQSGQRQYERTRFCAKIHPLKELRNRGIYPME
jgi:hypothetical protein